ncbi:hypothetical protein MTO96_045733 [Rhipicephalus appendiculatus]
MHSIAHTAGHVVQYAGAAGAKKDACERAANPSSPRSIAVEGHRVSPTIVAPNPALLARRPVREPGWPASPRP